MKKLELNQMAETEGGWNPLICLAGGGILGILFSPAVGIPFAIACSVLNPQEAR